MNNIPHLKKRIMLIIAAVILLFAAVFAFTGIYHAKDYYPVPLMYHLISEAGDNPYVYLFVRPEDFEEQLISIKEAGYGFCFADDYGPKEDKNVILSFDDGYTDNYTEMFPLLKKHNAKATVFLVTDLIGTDGYMTWEQIIEMSESGLVSFGSHTKSHNKLTELTGEEEEQELKLSKELIEEKLGKSCTAVSYPEGCYDKDTMTASEKYYDFAYTSKGIGLRIISNYDIPRFTAAGDLELPKLMKAINSWNKRLAR